MKKFNGSFTLEAVIVMSSILIIMFAVFYAFMLLYQQTIVMQAASYAAEQGAKEWNENNEGLYWRLSGDTAEKTNNAKNIAEEKLKSGIISVKSSNIDAQYSNTIGQRKLTVTITQKISVPFDLIAKFFNGGEDMELKATATATVVEPTEYIRNLDYGKEILTTITEMITKKLKQDDAIGKILSALEKYGL